MTRYALIALVLATIACGGAAQAREAVTVVVVSATDAPPPTLPPATPTPAPTATRRPTSTARPTSTPWAGDDCLDPAVDRYADWMIEKLDELSTIVTFIPQATTTAELRFYRDWSEDILDAFAARTPPALFADFHASMLFTVSRIRHAIDLMIKGDEWAAVGSLQTAVALQDSALAELDRILERCGWV